MTSRFWAVADVVAHRVHTPWNRIQLIPARLMHWVCDRYERSLGVTETEMYRR